MNSKKFSEAMGELDSKYVDEAINYKKKAKKPIWLKWGAMAACLCLIVGGVVLFNQNIGNNSPGNNIAMLFTEAKVIEVYSPRSVLVEIVEDNIDNVDTEEYLFHVGDLVQADFNEDIVLYFAADDIVVIGRGDTAKVDYSTKPYIAQCNSIRIKAEEDYRNIRVDDIEYNDGAENTGLAFMENIYGSFLMNLPEDNSYQITDYKLIDNSALVTTENTVSGEFTFAIKTVNEDFYAGQYTLNGSGEYDGWLILRKSFTLEHRNTGYWHCIKLENAALPN